MIASPRAPLRAAIIIDGPTIWAWAANALTLALAKGRIEVVAVFVCTNNISERNIATHFGYYAIRALLMRPAATKRCPIAPLIAHDIEYVSFAADLDGYWQRIPEETSAHARALDIDVAIKFGMGLLRDPQDFPARYGVLSYHHGDPGIYRGRPVGFYELTDDAPCIGAGVQRLTNRLDGGEFLATGRYRIERHSYRDTLESVFSGSSCLLEKALAACTKKSPTVSAGFGKNYRLPRNLEVARFLFRLCCRKVRRLLYGFFQGKAWRVLEGNRPNLAELAGTLNLDGVALPLPPATHFIADPFYLDETKRTIACERMAARSAFGDIVQLNGGGSATPILSKARRHFSYPFVVRTAGHTFIVPEVASWSAPFLVEFNANSSQVGPNVPLKGLKDERLLDPTLIFRDGSFWLFASPNIRFRKLDTLLLFVADRIEGPYAPHPLNPIVLDPRCARPGGRILEIENRLLRFGQNNSANYGGGLSVSEIEVMTHENYRERTVGQLSLPGMVGPHTIDFAESTILFDGYRDTFDPLALAKRLRTRL